MLSFKNAIEKQSGPIKKQILHDTKWNTGRCWGFQLAVKCMDVGISKKYCTASLHTCGISLIGKFRLYWLRPLQRGKTPHSPPKYPVYDTKLHLVVRSSSEPL